MRTGSVRQYLRAIGLTTLFLSAIPGPAAGQEGATPLSRLFEDRLEVRVVNLEVVVTDRKGVRVEGLAPEDFRLLVDGEEVEVEYFSEIADGAVEATLGAEAGTESRFRPAPNLEPGGVVGTDYLIFIDDFFSVAAFRNSILRRMADEVSLLGPGDRMAVMAFDGRRLEMLSDWSSSQAHLQGVLKKARRRRAYGLQRRSERNTLDENRRNFRPTRFSEEDLYSVPAEERQYAEQLAGQIERAVDAATATLRGFGPTPGRSVMLLLSGGWPLSPAGYAVESFDRQLFSPDREVGDDLSLVRGGTGLYGDLTHTANQLGYTLYPVDVPGLDSGLPDATAAELRDETAAGFAASSTREDQAHDTLRHLADETGGKPLLDGARLESLARVQGDTRSYYWLGFTVERQADDREHRIEVELERSDLKLRHRRRFIDRSQGSEMDQVVETALRFGRARGVEDTLAVRIGKAEKSGFRKVVLPVDVALPLDQVTVLPAGGRWRVELELRVVSLNRDGIASDVAVIPIRLALDERPKVGGVGVYQTRLELRRERHDVLVALCDPITGRVFSALSEVDP